MRNEERMCWMLIKVVRAMLEEWDYFPTSAKIRLKAESHILQL